MFADIKTDLQTVIELASTILETVEESEEENQEDRKSCMICASFDEVKELCGKYQARPAARIIAYGCESFEDMGLEMSQNGVMFRDGVNVVNNVSIPEKSFEEDIPF